MGYPEPERAFDWLWGKLATLNGDKERLVILPTIKLLSRNLVLGCRERTTFFYIRWNQKTFRPDLVKLLEMCRDVEIRVPIKKVFGLDDIKTARERWSKAMKLGSLVVRVSF